MKFNLIIFLTKKSIPKKPMASSSSNNQLPSPPNKRTKTDGNNNNNNNSNEVVLVLNTNKLVVANHPIIKHKLAQLRRGETSAKHFRELLNELSIHLGYSATQDLETKEVPIQTPVTSCTGHVLSSRVAVVPIMRSGLGMLEALLNVVPMATVYHIGMYRNPESLLPVLYFNKLPTKCESDVAIVLDPQIGTGSTLIAVVDLLKEWFTAARGKDGPLIPFKIKIVSVVASKEGILKITSAHPDVELHVAAVDEECNNGQAFPGFGDPGSRMYNAS
jgi:uracil phosphoribosyltransferase